MTTLLTVTGATGTQGSAVINHFIQYQPHVKLRGLTRNVNSAKSKELIEKGVEMVEAEYDDFESLKKAFLGTDFIYAYTDFSSIVESEAARELVKSGKADSQAHAARSIAIQQGKNVGDAAATVSKLQRLVWSTTADTDRESNGKYAGAFELENKAVVLRYLRNLTGLKDKVNALYLSIFLNAIINFPWFFGWTKLNEGEYVFRQPIRTDTQLPWADLDMELGRFVVALLGSPAGTDVELTSMKFSFDDISKLLSDKYDISVKAEQIPLEEYIGTDTTGYALNGFYMLAFMEDYGSVGKTENLLSSDELIPDQKSRRRLDDIDWAATLLKA